MKILRAHFILFFSCLVLLNLTGAAIACDTDSEPCPDNVYDGGYSIQYQSDLEYLKGYTEVTGRLTISGPDVGENLVGLECLRTIGSLVIGTTTKTTSLKSLEGLDNLTTINGEFKITNSEIENLEPLTSLNTISGAFYLKKLPNFQTFFGLPWVESVESLYIDECPNLKSLAGFRNWAVDGILCIVNMDSLKNLIGMENITSLRALFISNNNSLKNLDGLQNLQEQTGVGSYEKNYFFTTTIVNNSNLKSLCGLNSLEAVQGLHIEKNASLESLSGLNNLTRSYNTWYFNTTIRNNNKLVSIADLNNLELTQRLYIDGNESLKTLMGLEKVSVKNQLCISNNKTLVDLSALNSVTFGSLEITGNQALELISGLPDLSNVSLIEINENASLRKISLPYLLQALDFKIQSNPSLEIVEIDNLVQAGFNFLGDRTFSIANNASLTDINAPGFSKCNGEFDISNNVELCENIAYEILEQVQAENTVNKVNVSNNKVCE